MNKRLIPTILLAGMLASCTVTVGLSSSSQSTSEEISSSISSNLSSSYDSSSVLVYFANLSGEIYSWQTVEIGAKVEKPADPEPEGAGYRFEGWFTREGEEYDFSSRVFAEMTLFSHFSEIDYFEGYDPKYQPSVSALACNDVLIEGQKDIVLHLSSKNVAFKDGIAPHMVRLSGAFDGLKVTNVAKEEGKLYVQTQGTLKSGKGVVCLSKEVSDIGVFLTASFPILETESIIDRTSFGFNDERTAIDFSVHLPKGISLRNEEKLSKEDFMAKVNSGEYPYLLVKDGEGYSVQMLELADDFLSFRLRLNLPKEMDKDLLQELATKAKIHIAPEALSGNFPIDFPVDLVNVSSKSTIKMYRKNGDEYHGYLTIKLRACRVNNAFKDKIEALLKEPNNKNLLVSMEGVDVVMNKLSVDDSVTIKGEFTVPSSIGESASASVSIKPLKNPDDGSSLPIAMDFIDGSPVDIDAETVSATLDQSLEPGGGTGTMTQNSVQNYKEVKTVVEQSCFHDSGDSDGLGDLGTVISAATNIGKIGFGLYSGNYTAASYGAAELFGIEGLKNPSTRILSALASIAGKLQEIESKIDNITSKLQSIQAQLEKLGQQALLTNYLAANTRWNDFLTDYYVPLKDAIISYSNDYFRYYYDLIIDSYDPYPGNEPKITLYYDRNGNLAFPGRNPSLSIDGKPIDKAATKTVTLPVLNYSLGGVFASDGHVYSSIEDDVIADLSAYELFDEDLIVDIVATIRYNAMSNHFTTPASLDAFSLTFVDFCTSFTATEFGTGVQASITPLDAYRIMLETIYNFGFEIEPEFNLAVVNLESTYYCARSIMEFTKFVNSGEIISSRYDELEEAVKKELTDNRFYHSNRDDKAIYCYASGCYVKTSCDAFGLAVDIYWSYGGDGPDHLDVYLNRGNTYDVKNWGGIPGLSSIDEASVRLMALKVNLYNSLKGTNYDFRSYLVAVGIVPKDKVDQSIGVVLGVYGFEDDDDTIEGLRLPKGWSLDVDRWKTYALKGKCYSFADGDAVDGALVAITWDPGAAPLGGYTGPINITNVGYVVGSYTNFGVWAYYVNFAPA